MDQINNVEISWKSEGSIVEDIPEILPILPLRDIVIFPYMIFRVIVGRAKSIRASNFASKKKK